MRDALSENVRIRLADEHVPGTDTGEFPPVSNII